MASKLRLVLGALGGVGVAVGAALVVLAPVKKPAPAVDVQAVAAELDTRLAEVASAVHARTETLADLTSLRASVATDPQTVENQTRDDLQFKPSPGEVITLAQLSAGAPPLVLLVWPASATAARGLDRNGARVVLDGDRVALVEIVSVDPKYQPDPAHPKRGALAVSRPIELGALRDRLLARGASLQLQAEGGVLALGRPADPKDVKQPLALTSPLGKTLTAVLGVAPTPAAPPYRALGAGLALLSLLVSALALRRGEPLATANTLPQGAASSNAGAAQIGAGSVIQDTYEVTRLLGQGGMGAVWEAQHLRLPDKRVAVKLLIGEHVDPELFARFRREAEVTSKLGHPNIVGVLDFNTLPGGAPYIVLELLEGESLAQRLERGPLPLAEALAIARQIGSALAAAHRAEIVHRDLKPDNVFLTRVAGEERREQVKVLDFGISKMRGSLSTKTQDQTMLGTPQYMSPEQANGKNSEVDARSDVWALAAIVFEMLTGRAAFGADTLAQVIVKIVVEPSPTLRGTPGVPEHVAAAIERALAKAPDARFPDVRDFIAALTGAPLVTAAHDAQG